MIGEVGEGLGVRGGVCVGGDGLGGWRGAGWGPCSGLDGLGRRKRVGGCVGQEMRVGGGVIVEFVDGIDGGIGGSGSGGVFVVGLSRGKVGLVIVGLAVVGGKISECNERGVGELHGVGCCSGYCGC